MASAPDGGELLSSLPYQVLLVFGGWFYVVFAAVELFLLLFKGLSFPYPSGNMASEVCLLAFLTVVENVRLTLASVGNPEHFFIWAAAVHNVHHLTRPIPFTLRALGERLDQLFPRHPAQVGGEGRRRDPCQWTVGMRRPP
ncbi:transmembrane protein 216-like isoform X2 [Haemaphysalis longicornis]